MMTAEEARTASLEKQNAVVPSIVAELEKHIAENIANAVARGSMTTFVRLQHPLTGCLIPARESVFKKLGESGYAISEEASLPNGYVISWK